MSTEITYARTPRTCKVTPNNSSPGEFVVFIDKNCLGVKNVALYWARRRRSRRAPQLLSGPDHSCCGANASGQLLIVKPCCRLRTRPRPGPEPGEYRAENCFATAPPKLVARQLAGKYGQSFKRRAAVKMRAAWWAPGLLCFVSYSVYLSCHVALLCIALPAEQLLHYRAGTYSSKSCQ